jgi:hypothetical protein
VKLAPLATRIDARRELVQAVNMIFSDINQTGDIDKLIDKLNKAGEKGWRAKGMSMTGGQMYVLMEKEK